MSDDPTTSPATGDNPAQGEAPEPAPVDTTDWKAKAREWERRAKENKGAADKLAQFEDANKTEMQKLTERLEAAERDLAARETAALRSEVALEKGLSASQARRLLGSSREELEADAEQLIADLGEQGKPRPPRPDPNQGRPTTGTPTSGDLFAAAIEPSFTR